MFSSIEYLKKGSPKQQRAYHSIKQLGILHDLFVYTPVLCGTIPIGIDLENSDLDIIMHISDHSQFSSEIKRLYGQMENFSFRQIFIHNKPVSIANFLFSGFEYELFGQNKPVKEQNAYLHMMIQYRLLTDHPSLRERIIELKRAGYKTEPAFCIALGLTDADDPYSRFIEWGREQGYIP